MDLNYGYLSPHYEAAAPVPYGLGGKPGHLSQTTSAGPHYRDRTCSTTNQQNPAIQWDPPSSLSPTRQPLRAPAPPHPPLIKEMRPPTSRASGAML
ncbi:hypothetical protein FDECE_3931 [Fusarium decemcellulare]|nr:hypothetical protein FDECE_3931 [Fusarium decemcellulare]